MEPNKFKQTKSRSGHFFSPFRAVLCALCIFQISGNLIAQETDSDEEIYELSPFMVTSDDKIGYSSQLTTLGSRTVKRLIDIPGSVSIINEQFITDLGATDVQEVLDVGVSGVTQNQTTTDDFNIRGFRSGNSFRNGISKTLFKSNPLYDVARVEIVKGPIAMLFGNSGALGGAVNLVSKLPTLTPKGDVRVTVGEQNYFRASVNVSGPIFKNDNGDSLAYRVTGGLTTDDRWKEIESDDETFFGGALTYKVGKTIIQIDGYVFEDTGYVYFNDFIDINFPERVVLNKYSTLDFSPARSKDVFHDVTEKYFHFDMTNNVSENFAIRTAYTYSQANDRRRLLRTVNVLDDNYTLTRQDFAIGQDFENHTGQIDFLYELETDFMRHELNGGIEVQNLTFVALNDRVNGTNIDSRDPDFSQDSVLPDGHFSWSRQNFVQDTDNLSYFIQDTLSILDERIQLVGGLRWIEKKVSVEDRRDPDATDNVTLSRDPRKRVHRLGAIFKPLENVSIYYLNSETFQLRSGFGGINDDIPFEDSEGTLDEIGLKWDAMDSRFYGIISFFDMALTNVPTLAVAPDGDTYTTQTAKDTSKGFEVEVGYSIPMGDVGQFDTVVTYYNTDAKTATGIRPNDAVKEAYSILGKFKFDSGILQGSSFGLAYNYQGGRIVRASRLVDPIETISLFASYRFNDNWNMQLNIRNLTDEVAVATYATAGLVQRIDPRRVKFTVTYNW